MVNRLSVGFGVIENRQRVFSLRDYALAVRAATRHVDLEIG